MESLIKLLKKHIDVISYLFFGACTTVINIAVFWLCYDVLHLPNIPSNVIAWVLAVAFAFITNKLWVFKSKKMDKNTLAHEIISFTTARLLTGGLDLLIMWLAVDVAHGPSLVFKILSNIIVIVLNYVASKLYIFKPNK